MQMVNWPLMNTATLIPQSHSNCTHFTQVKILAVVVVVWCYPAYPYWGRVLTCKHSHWVEILKHKQRRKYFRQSARKNFYNSSTDILRTNVYLCDAAIISLPAIILLSFLSITAHLVHISDFPGTGIKLDRHAQAAVDHVTVASLSSKGLMAHLQTWWRVHSPINSSHLTKNMQFK